jgi:hypothetical protein
MDIEKTNRRIINIAKDYLDSSDFEDFKMHLNRIAILKESDTYKFEILTSVLSKYIGKTINEEWQEEIFVHYVKLGNKIFHNENN